MSNAPKCTQCGVVLAPRNVTGLCLEHSRAKVSGLRRDAIPEGFAEVAADSSVRALSKRFGACHDVIVRWRKSLGLDSNHYKKWANDDGFLRANYGSMSSAAIAEHLNRTVDSVKTRAKKLGLIKARPAVYIRRETQVRMMAGHSGAAAYLQAYGPIFRCHKDGAQSPIGAYWYWAGQVLTHDEMEAKARSHRERRALLGMAA